MSDRTEYIGANQGYAPVKYGLFQGTIRTEYPSRRTLVLSSKLNIEDI